VERIFERYLVAGEGRVDHISGYMDGFALWKRLFETGCQGILRGDQAFGRATGVNDDVVRYETGLTCLADYENLRRAGLPAGCPQALPPFLVRQDGESRQQWNDRLFQTFRHPTILAALNDLKCAYVEIANPLLSLRVVQCMRRVPDRFRENKGLHREIVRRGSHSIAFAERAAINPAGDILRQEHVIGHIIGYLRAHGGGLCGGAVLTYIEAGLARVVRRAAPAMKSPHRLKRFLKTVLPADMIAAVKHLVGGRGKSAPRHLDIYRLAYRAYIICRMGELLRRDADLLKRHG